MVQWLTMGKRWSGYLVGVLLVYTLFGCGSSSSGKTTYDDETNKEETDKEGANKEEVNAEEANKEEANKGEVPGALQLRGEIVPSGGDSKSRSFDLTGQVSVSGGGYESSSASFQLETMSLSSRR